jgi:hypothetical protein
MIAAATYSRPDRVCIPFRGQTTSLLGLGVSLKLGERTGLPVDDAIVIANQ